MPSFRVEELETEGSYYIGIVIFAIVYGVYLGVYCLSIHALLSNTNATRLHRNFYIVFSSILLLLNTLSFLAAPYTAHMTWIVMRNYPGGPITYLQSESNTTPAALLGNIAQTLTATLNDGLLAYRCYIIFGSRLYVVLLPVLCTLGTLALGVALMPFSVDLNSTEKLGKLNAAAIALDTAVNVMVTAMISIKILSISWVLRKYTDSTTAHARTYTNVVVILVESAAPCAILGILTCTGFFINADDPTSAFGLSSSAITLTWTMSIALFPQLIIYRVAKGSAWTEKTSQELTQATGALVFASRATHTKVLGLESNALVEGVDHHTDDRRSAQALPA